MPIIGTVASERRATVSCTALLLAACLSVSAPGPQERSFATGQAGSLPTDPKLMARTYFDDPAVRTLIFEMEEGPVATQRVQSALAETDVALDDLLRTKILRRDGDLFYIGFNYFNEDDMRAVHAAAEERVPSLVDAYLARKDDFYRIFDRYPAESVPREMLAYALVAGFSLNWDGLEITREHGWREPVLVRGESPAGTAWQYSFWASETVPDYSVRAFFTASTTFPGGPFNYEDPVDFAYSSYGDGYSDPRMSFPDLLYLPGEALAEPVREIAERIGLADRTEMGLELDNALGFELGRSVAPLLFALRNGPRTEQQLRDVVLPEHVDQLPDILALLEETQYIARDNGRAELRFPALDGQDAALVDEALALSREILADWLDANYGAMRSNLGELTAMRHGVPFESLFTEIWHNLFGLATRELVAAGFLADPYGDDVRYKGSLPVVWRLSLYDFSPG